MEKIQLNNRTRFNERDIALRNVKVLTEPASPLIDCLVNLQETSTGFNDLVYAANQLGDLQYCNDDKLKNARELNNTIRELTIALREAREEADEIWKKLEDKSDRLAWCSCLETGTCGATGLRT